MKNKLRIDYERNIVSVPLSLEPMVLMVNQGKAQLCVIPKYGEFIAKTHEGKITHYAVTESGRF